MMTEYLVTYDHEVMRKYTSQMHLCVINTVNTNINKPLLFSLCRSHSTPTLVKTARCVSWPGTVMASGCPSGWTPL